MIHDLKGRTNVGCVVAAGRKGPNGAPTERDRFHVVWPVEDDRGVRAPHPQFAPYNAAPPERRRSIFGVLTHATQEECFEYSYRAQAPKGERQPASRRPFCSGDGRTAQRFTGMNGTEEVFTTIACPARECPFQKTDPAGCKPHLRLLFMLAWAEGSPLPSMLAKFTSNSYHTMIGAIGFFDAIYGVAASFGIPRERVNLAGLRFVLTLTERKNAAKRSRYPVVTMTPVDNIVAFLEAQMDRSHRLTTAAPVAALTDREQQTPEATAADYRQNEPAQPAQPTRQPTTPPPTLAEVLAAAGATMDAADAWFTAKGKPAVSTVSPAKQNDAAGWLTNTDPGRAALAEIVALSATTATTDPEPAATDAPPVVGSGETF